MTGDGCASQLLFQEFAAVLASMTGFGEARAQSPGLTVTVEVRTINNRHFKLSFRATEGYASLEPDVESVVRQLMRRGTVQVNLRVERQASADDYRINDAVVRSYRLQVEGMVGREKWRDQVSLEALLQLPGAINEKARTGSDP